MESQMSELEQYLPRLQKRTRPFIPSIRQPDVTNWPDEPEMYRETLDEWTDCQGFKPTDKHTQDKWKHGTRLFVEAHGEKPWLLREAWEFYLDIPFERRQDIVIETPRSLIAFARKVLDNKAHRKREDMDLPENRKRYLKGWYDDD
jgi:hypothetical protein